ncbi:MAG: hypothetical protein JWO22_3036 [Frankiales bacterium]|nr:hypothetical protein [Frankiales bacterium]
MTGLLRAGARVVTVSALVVGTLPLGGVVHADAVRTDTTLAGFAVSVEATPLRILLDDPKLQIPHDAGTAVLEADPNYTLASVKSGPNARAVTSTLWPGNLLGEGLAQVAAGAPAYPLKGEARYPDKPYDHPGVDNGQLSGAHAEGLTATATADGTPTNKPGQVMVGAVNAVSNATVDEKNVAVGTATSAVQDVDLLGGVIHVGSVASTLSTSSDGTKSRSTGTTTVSGLTIAGQAFSVDDKGLHAAGSGSALPGLDTPAAVSDKLGITAHVINQSAGTMANGISRAAGGLVIKVDTAPLRAALSPATTVVNPVLNGLIAQITKLNPSIGSNLYYFVKATPNITFVFGSANSSSAATLPLKITFPGFGNPFPPAIGGGLPPVSTPGGNPGVGTAVIPGITPTTPDAPPTYADGTPAAPTVQPGTSNAAATDAGSKGIGAGWLFGALVGSGLVGWVLMRFLGLAGGALGIGCRLGAPTSVPNLRSVTA